MTQTDLFRLIVGTMILASVLIGLLVTPWAFAFTLFIGANLFQSAFTRICPLANMLAKSRRPVGREV